MDAGQQVSGAQSPMVSMGSGHSSALAIQIFWTPFLFSLSLSSEAPESIRGSNHCVRQKDMAEWGSVRWKFIGLLAAQMLPL